MTRKGGRLCANRFANPRDMIDRRCLGFVAEALRVFRTHLLCVSLLCVAASSAQAQRAPPTWGIQPLMTALGQVRASTAHFVETRYLHLLNQAQRSSGRLTYVAPDRLWKETTEPAPMRMTVIGDHLTIERQGERTRDISLRDYSEIGALVDAVRATLAGDLPALTRHFNVSLEGGASGWTLLLAPKEPKLLDLVTAIRILGQQAAIRGIETLEADGDRTDMAIDPGQP